MEKKKKYKLSLKEYKKLFESHYASLCVFSNTFIKDSEISKDIVQEIFIKIWENKISFNSKKTVKSFLFTAVRNKALDYLKSSIHKKTESHAFESIINLETESVFLREVVITETSIIIEHAINTLPEKCAEIIKLSIKEYSNAAIAESLSISINTVKAQKKIAYKRLRPVLKEYFILIISIFD
ncbi:RNA polymerase sigma-70 factor [Aureibaculum sp. A20]|uniref:RNA polymerase sigma-70 factor n=1 Tax=Aureibaculum flavum TaxID=2795986 RepID=A0ABS0WU92_9FLAO|nr:RNA polymerase sigma-70 factor [Aureibaculum flavum]MBJ2175537.1 RNA polymerase sigma-70 factor [Aureibaculum flavum]